MSEIFALGGFLAQWSGLARHDLSASESATLSLSSLLAMGDLDDRRRWRDLSLGYAEPNGAPWLRATIARRYGDLAPDHVLCCAGAQEALACLLRALLTPSDHAVVVVPIYQPSEQAVTSLCAATGVPLEYAGGWHLDIARVAAAILPSTRLVLLNTPNSPTGAVLDAATLADLVALCRRHGIWLVNDEVYRAMADDTTAAPPRVADMYERGVSIDAVSKALGLPGLRVGWVACRDRALLARAGAAKSAMSGCVAATNEVLARIALHAETPIVARNRAIASVNRQALRTILARYPEIFGNDTSKCLAFSGPCYLGTRGAMRFAVGVAREAGVLLVPSGLWQSSLAEVPTNRLRIGLGAAGVPAALKALDAHLASALGRRWLRDASETV
jgi:aspartate/methionine/tyrosine aminotransferase